VLLTALAVAALAFAAATLVVRAWPVSNVFALVAAIGSPYAPFVALTGLVLAALSRRILLSIIAVLVVTATSVFLVPQYYFGRSTEGNQYADIRMLSSNLRKGRADASSFVGLATESADVITVSELTPEEAERFSQAGIGEVFPYSVLIPAAGAGGIGLWSRFPLTTVTPGKRPGNMAIAAARLRVPGVRLHPLVASVHVTSPVANERDSVDDWRRGIAAAKAVLDGFADAAGSAAVIVAGDFNSTHDMRQFRDLLTNGYRDAVEQTGAGFVPTFPANSWLPPVLAIDHVLTRGCRAATVRATTIAGSDHRGLLATVQIPRAP
jgi:endonuclease/exonuclease/phosphatase (EEP) superfamily protein YafD